MDARNVITVLFLLAWLLFSPGCGNQDAYLSQYVEILHGDIRALKDHIYDLEYENEILLAELDELKHPEKTDDESADTSDSATRPPNAKRNRDRGMPDDLDVSPPIIDEGEPQPPGTEFPLPEAQSRELPEPQENVANQPGPNRPLRVSHRDDRVTHIVITPQSGGWNFDELASDDGILLVLEPRNSAEEFVPQAGAISVVLLDPVERGDRARVARWDITSQRVKEILAASSAQPGIRLQLPWPDQAPIHPRLHLFVRLETEDGRQLEADREILVNRPGQYSQRWTPRTERIEAVPSAHEASRKR